MDSIDRPLAQELMDDFGLDAGMAEGMVSLAKRVHSREGSVSVQGLLRLVEDACAQDPLLRLYLSGDLPGSQE